jgi:copper transport protein
MPRVVLVLLAVAATALAGPAPAAQAHSFLVASNPADGQVLVEAPSQLRLDFSESVVLGATRIDVVDGSGRRITPTGLRLVSHGNAGDTELPVEVVANLPILAHSSYRVSWETLSSDDLHSTSGVLVFGVGQPVTAGGLAEPSPSPIEAGLRWLILVGLSGALGGALAIRLLERAGGPEASRVALLARKISAGGAIIGAGVAVILLVSQLAAGGGRGAALLWSSYGVRWGLREVGLLLLLGSATVRAPARTVPARASRLLLPAGAALATGGTAMLGHSGAGAAPNITRVIASAAHLGAATTWAGCVVVLSAVLVLRVGGGAPSRDLARTVLRGFGPPAAACVAVMVVTGVYLSSKVIGSVDAALFTVYGRTLLAKVTLAGVAGSLALANTLRLRRHGGHATPGRTVVAEALVALGVLALAGVLTSAQPAMEPQLVHATTSASSVVDGAVADLQETVSISPNRPGASVVLVAIFDTRRPSPGPVREVLVSLLGASGRGEPQSAEKLSNGRWSLATRLVDPGATQVQVLVRRAGLPDARRSFAWTIGGTPGQTRAAVISTAPIGAVLEAAAGVLMGLVLAAWALVASLLLPWLRRRGTLSQDHQPVRPGSRSRTVPVHDLGGR